MKKMIARSLFAVLVGLTASSAVMAARQIDCEGRFDSQGYLVGFWCCDRGTSNCGYVPF